MMRCERRLILLKINTQADDLQCPNDSNARTPILHSASYLTSGSFFVRWQRLARRSVGANKRARLIYRKDGGIKHHLDACVVFAISPHLNDSS